MSAWPRIQIHREGLHTAQPRYWRLSSILFMLVGGREQAIPFHNQPTASRLTWLSSGHGMARRARISCHLA
jgi:hypothetical protein